eukprot:TRINITY_DN1009_c1_g1_i2.p1 TRINITY_DN1009_c1_g1~~TRINITY_DN1009_c1_g1_i2.p1  ORF type:complete len:667 (-),score=140.06 TRINITY_DN1009_c1_g1_i2:717-2696(-)
MSQILSPYRAIGVYTDTVPFDIERRGTVHFAVFSIQKTYHVYNCEKLTLVNAGMSFKKKITSIAMKKNVVFAASDNAIHICWRSKLKAKLEGHSKKIISLLVLGNYLISLGLDEKIIVWDHKNEENINTIQLSNLKYTTLLHPNTYVNKVLLGTAEGVLELWNIRTGKLIYTFEGWESSVVSLAQSPLLDIVAIGLADGRIIVHNLKLDKTVLTLKQNKTVTSLAFRSDGRNILASSDPDGTIHLWDLDDRSLLKIMTNAHQRGITKLYFYDQEPLLMSAGLDNAINLWIFDRNNDKGRLLRSRSGHILPPSKIEFYVTSSMIISAGIDRSLRIFSTVKDQRNREFSQGNIQKLAKKKESRIEHMKLSSITDFDALRIRQREWDNIITSHDESDCARTWSKENYRLGAHKLKSTSPTPTVITSVAISSCGNFAIIGAKNGWIDIFNIQSGIHRGTFSDSNGHSNVISGLIVNQNNTLLISSSLDGTLKFWSFKHKIVVHSIDIGSPISKIVMNKESGLVAVISDDFNIRLYDNQTKRLVRHFLGHAAYISDACFSGDGRWLVTTDSIGEMRIWDIPSGRCIDWFKMKSPVTSVSFSPSSSFIATTHVKSNAIFLWANKSYFTDVYLKPIPSSPSLISMPTLAAPAEINNEDSEMSDEGF